MSKQVINTGDQVDDGTGDTLRDAFNIVNDNFSEIYNELGGSSVSDIKFISASISTDNLNQDLTLDPNGSGSLLITANTEITGNLTVSGNITGSLIGNVYADDGINSVLENGTNGTDAVFLGSVTGTVSSIVNHTTTDLTEGLNLYYTDARVDTYLTTNNYATETYVTSAIATKDNTDEINEGVLNLYYTDTRVDARIVLNTGSNLDLSGKSTTDLLEGTNLYYTDARVITAVDNSTLTGLTVNDLSITGNAALTGTLDVTGNLTASSDLSVSGDALIATDVTVGGDLSVSGGITGNVTGTVSSITNHTTTNLTEGTNLYYTDAKVQSVIDTKKASQFVDAGVDVILGNLKARIPTSGNRSLQLSTVSGTYAVYGSMSGVAVGIGTASVLSSNLSITTTPVYVDATDTFGTQGDVSVWNLVDPGVGKAFRITLVIGPLFVDNLITIEELT